MLLYKESILGPEELTANKQHWRRSQGLKEKITRGQA